MYEAKSQNPDNMVRCALVDSGNSNGPSAEVPVGRLEVTAGDGVTVLTSVLQTKKWKFRELPHCHIKWQMEKPDLRPSLAACKATSFPKVFPALKAEAVATDTRLPLGCGKADFFSRPAWQRWRP